MGQHHTKIKVPTFGLIRNLKTLQEIPLCTVRQIQEAFEYFQDTPYTNQLSLNQAAFEDVFSALFQDPNAHFSTFQRFGQSCSTMEIFLLLILFSDASLIQKLRLICDIHPELRSSIRLDALQLVIYRVLSSMPFLFKMEIPSRDEVYSFVEKSVHQYQERVQLSTQQLESSLEQAHGPNTLSNTLDFKNLWQWCQDVHQVSSYLDAIQHICQNITNRIDRSYKGRSWIARNSFFSSSQVGRNSIMGNLMNALNAWGAMEETMEKIVLHRTPMWKYTVQEISQVNSEYWLEDGPTLSYDTKLFTAWEHLVLSQQLVLPVYRPTNTLQAVVVQGGSQPSSHSINSNSNYATPMGMRSGNGFHQGSKIHSAAPSPYNNNATNGLLSTRSTTREFNFTTPRGAASDGFSFPNNHSNVIGHGSSNSVVLWCSFDRMTLMSYLLQSCPENAFQSFKEEEEKKRTKRLSYDFNLAAAGAGGLLDDLDDDTGEEKSDNGDLEERSKPAKSFDFSGENDVDDEGVNNEDDDNTSLNNLLMNKQSSYRSGDNAEDPLANRIDSVDEAEKEDIIGDIPWAIDTSGSKMQRSESNSSVRLSLPQSFHQRKNDRMQQKQTTSNKLWQSLGETMTSSSIDELFTSLRLEILHNHHHHHHHANSNANIYTPKHRDSVSKPMNAPMSRQPSGIPSSSMFHQPSPPSLAPYHVRQAMLYRIRHSAVSFGATHPVSPLLTSVTGTASQALTGNIPTMSLPGFSMKHHAYNIMMAIAQGYRYVPILSLVEHNLPNFSSQHPYYSVGLGAAGIAATGSATNNNSSSGGGTSLPNTFNVLFPSKVLHMVAFHEVAAFLLEYYDEFFGPGYTPAGDFTSNDNQNQNQNLADAYSRPQSSTTRAPFAKQAGIDEDDEYRERTDQFKLPGQSPPQNNPKGKRRRASSTNSTSSGIDQANPSSPDSHQQHIPFARHFVADIHGEYLGYRPLYYTNLMRKAVTVPHDTNLASAWLMMLSSSVDSILVTDETEKVCGVVTAKHLDSLWWHYKQQHEATVQFSDLVSDYAKGVYHVYDTSANNPQSTANNHAGGMDSFSGLLGGHHHFMNKPGQPQANSMHNFTPMSMLVTTLDACQRIDIHTFPFDTFLAANDQDADIMMTLWESRCIKASQLEELQEKLMHSHNKSNNKHGKSGHKDTFKHALHNHVQHHLRSQQATPRAMDVPDTPSSAMANNNDFIQNNTSNNNNNNNNNTNNNSNSNNNTTATTAMPDPSAASTPAATTSGGEAPFAATATDVYTSSKPQSSSRRRPQPPSTKVNTAAPPTGTNINNINTNGTSTGPASTPVPPSSANGPAPQSSGGGGGVGTAGAAGGRTHRHQAAHRQREKQKMQSRLRTALKRRLEKWFRVHHFVSPNDQLRAVLEIMAKEKVHSVHVVSLEGEAMGVITLQDVCRIVVTAEARVKGLEGERLTRAENVAAMKLRNTNNNSNTQAGGNGYTQNRRASK